ncbi:hypothetical protein L596_004321 [Steinernema carpocapsae]|uniref:Uncharacterized protein n=1 Tax=Steinernema carpocapsae TaxID=34508 RepID=A0A4U8UX23_STECR|nr:hypothetical protein L596_004321 [Steinernema carpocapsae]
MDPWIAHLDPGERHGSIVARRRIQCIRKVRTRMSLAVDPNFWMYCRIPNPSDPSIQVSGSKSTMTSVLSGQVLVRYKAIYCQKTNF